MKKAPSTFRWTKPENISTLAGLRNAVKDHPQKSLTSMHYQTAGACCILGVALPSTLSVASVDNSVSIRSLLAKYKKVSEEIAQKQFSKEVLVWAQEINDAFDGGNPERYIYMMTQLEKAIGGEPVDVAPPEYSDY